jgi:hypothetical protein
MNRSRREFLADVGLGVLTASVGSALAADLGFGRVRAEEKDAGVNFGKMEPLVALMQETPANKLLPILVEKINGGTELQTLVAAAALANARTFGGEDYVGFHTMMALAPAWHMAREMPKERQALPILKVLFRNTTRIQEKGGRKDEVLRGTPLPVAVTEPGTQLRETVRAKKLADAEAVLLVAANHSAQKALDAMLVEVEDATEVHRVVLPYRAWELLPIVGKEHAFTMLRQSVHYCVQAESDNYVKRSAGVRALLPKLLEQHKLLETTKPREPRKVDDAWVEKLSLTLFKSKPDDAAGAVAEALADGIDSEAICEAIALATNQLVLRDAGRPKGQTSSNKPEGSIHGDSIGVHACDSANAWRNLARVSSGRNASACVILGAYQAAQDRTDRGGDFQNWEPYPRAEARDKAKGIDRDSLLKEAEGAIREKDQVRAAAIIARYGELGMPERAVFDLFLRYGVSEDGALHAEKFYNTTREEFNAARAAFRWRYPVALARVTASEFGQPAPGYKEACELLKV